MAFKHLSVDFWVCLYKSHFPATLPKLCHIFMWPRIRTQDKGWADEEMGLSSGLVVQFSMGGQGPNVPPYLMHIIPQNSLKPCWVKWSVFALNEGYIDWDLSVFPSITLFFRSEWAPVLQLLKFQRGLHAVQRPEDFTSVLLSVLCCFVFHFSWAHY